MIQHPQIISHVILSNVNGLCISYINLVNVTENLTTSVLTSGFLVIDDAG